MNINIVTLFPEIFSALSAGLLGQAIKREDININLIDLRIFALNEYGQVDSKPYGGGEGMVLMAQPLEEAIKSIPSSPVCHVVNLSPQGQQLTHSKAKELSKYTDLTIIAGRYEGIDERIINQFVDEEISIGDFVLSGGEFAALTLIDAFSRFIPGVIGNQKSVESDTFGSGLLKGPTFTRPEKFNDENVPEVLLSGNHAKIEEWRETQSLLRTLERRPELLNNIKLTKKQKKLLEDIVSKRIL
ncbi:tRNA (guanosine(37)-N1)-methyltransferase TrmD [Gammaproteobacteria bacterium]|nr:tRNA (guanosine(37)-N1)-methyltransferase TrmD [Gammaproteobacteria bacterium]